MSAPATGTAGTDWVVAAGHEALTETTERHLDSAQEAGEATDRARELAAQIRNGGQS